MEYYYQSVIEVTMLNAMFIVVLMELFNVLELFVM